jgi:hypothetical protein
MILELSKNEASAVSIALVGLIHDEDSRDQWRLDASAVANRLAKLRDEAE